MSPADGSCDASTSPALPAGAASPSVVPPRLPPDASSSPATSGARRVLVVGGSPQRPSSQLLSGLAREVDLVVACDAGADACLQAGVRVDVLVGDNDSLSPRALRHARSCGALEVGFPMDKDRVDLRLALDWARDRCPQMGHLTLTGVSGGRLDHELAVYGTLARMAKLSPRVVEDAFEARILSPKGASTWEFASDDLERTLSVFALLAPACVSERGTRWELDHAELMPLDDLGVSNVIERHPSSVTAHDGVALAILQRTRIPKRVTTL